MAGMGPPPKPAGTRARRNAAPQTTKLPADGRGTTRAPRWPLDPDVDLVVDRKVAEQRVKDLQAEFIECDDPVARRKIKRELAAAVRRKIMAVERLRRQNAQERKLWADLWKTPQAAMWEKLAWDREVAQYVRFQIRAESGSLDAAKEARQWSDRLGLNPLAMLRLRWEIERTEDAEERGRSAGVNPRRATPAGRSRRASSSPARTRGASSAS
jgi:hypothetical protein